MINNIQALRAFAALNVVLFHTLGVASTYGYESAPFAVLKEWGANGVDVFFVISGFVMVYIQSQNPKSPLDFIKNRLKRIVPLYWSLTAFLVALLYFMPSAFRQASFDARLSAASLFFVSRLSGAEHPVIQPGWTLEFEMLFYLVFGLCIALSRIDTPAVVSAVLVSLVLLGGVDPIVIEFILGMLVAKAYLRGYLRSYSTGLFVIGFLGLSSSIVFRPDVGRVILWGLPSAFLVLSCCYLPQTQSRVLAFLGAASYSIYLVHTITMPVFFKVIKFTGFPDGHAYLLVVLCVMFSALVGGALYYFYEKPLGHYVR